MPNAPDGSNPDKGEMSLEEIAEFQRRTNDLGMRIEGKHAKKKAEITAQEDKAMQARGMAYGLRMSTEFVAAILVGGLIGWSLDKWLGTLPWLFLVFMVLGMAAGVLNVTRAFRKMQAEIKRQTGGNIGRDVRGDDDDD